MGHYFFHLRVSGQLQEDTQGRVLSDLIAARSEALIVLAAAARQIDSDCIGSQDIVLEITNRNGNLLISVPFQDLSPELTP